MNSRYLYVKKLYTSVKKLDRSISHYVCEFGANLECKSGLRTLACQVLGARVG